MAMIELVYFAIFYVLCCFIVIWRLIKGPSAPDRVVAGEIIKGRMEKWLRRIWQ